MMHEDFEEFLVETPTAEYPKPESMAEAVEWWSSIWREREPVHGVSGRLADAHGPVA